MICHIFHPDLHYLPKHAFRNFKYTRLCFFCGLFLLFTFQVCLEFAVLSVPCSLVITCCHRKSWPLGSLVCDVFLCFCQFPIWCLRSDVVLDVSIPDLCLLLYTKYIIFFIFDYPLKTFRETNPLSCPVGPMEVANIRLKSIGSVMSFPVIGDFMLYFFRQAPISFLSISPICEKTTKY